MYILRASVIQHQTGGISYSVCASASQCHNLDQAQPAGWALCIDRLKAFTGHCQPSQQTDFLSRTAFCELGILKNSNDEPVTPQMCCALTYSCHAASACQPSEAPTAAAGSKLILCPGMARHVLSWSIIWLCSMLVRQQANYV